MEYMPGHAQNLDEMHLRLWFVKMVAKTDQTVVTALDPCAATDPILVLDCDGNPASTGKLCLSFDWSKLTLQEPVDGFNVVKELTGGIIKRGPAVIGIRPGLNAQIVGIGTENTDWKKDATTGIYYGELQVGLTSPVTEAEGSVELVALNSVRKDYDSTQQRLYLHFPYGFESSIRGRILLPMTNFVAAATPNELDLYFRFWFVSRQAGALPTTLVATYRRYPRPTGIDDLPAVGDEADIDIGGVWDPGITFTAAAEYAEVTTPAVQAYIGDIIDFTLGWGGTVAPAEGFGLLRLGYRAVLHV